MSSSPAPQSRNPSRAVPLGRLLIDRGLLTEEQLIQGLFEQNRTGELLGKVLIDLGFVDAPSVAMALATQHGGPLKTEYGFATGFNPEGPSEPQPKPTTPDAVALQPLPTEPGPTDETDATAGDSPAQAEAGEDEDESPPADDPAITGAIIAERDAAEAELDAARARIGDLDQELATARGQLEEERSKTAELEGKVNAAGARVADLDQELAAARERLEEERSRAAGLEDELAAVRLATETAVEALRRVTQAPV